MANLYHDNLGKFSKVDKAEIKNSLKNELAKANQDMSTYQTRLRKSKNPFGEYAIKSFAPDGIEGYQKKSYEPATYYTDDWDDAVNTFNSIAKQYGLEVKTDGKTWTTYKK